MIKIFDSKKYVVIDAQRNLSKIIYFGLYVQSLIYISISVYSFYFFFFPYTELSLFLCMIFLANIFFLFLGISFLKPIYQREKIVIYPTYVLICNYFLLRIRFRRYEKFKIKNIKISLDINFTKNNLDTGGMDYLGIAGDEKLAQFFVDDPKIEFEYSGSIIKFGKNLESWEAYQIVDLLKDSQELNR